jgi:hypothetical protein
MATKKNARRIEGASLVPSSDTLQSASVSQRYRYWCGALKTCPREVAYVGGIDFPKITEKVTPNPADPSRTMRIPRAGTIQLLSLEQVERIRDKLPRMVARSYRPKRDVTSASHEGRESQRSGKIITIKTEEELAELRANKLPTPTYTPEKGDEPLAAHLFMVLCEDQENGQPGTAYPEPLSVTGIELPSVPEEPNPPKRRGRRKAVEPDPEPVPDLGVPEFTEPDTNANP